MLPSSTSIWCLVVFTCSDCSRTSERSRRLSWKTLSCDPAKRCHLMLEGWRRIIETPVEVQLSWLKASHACWATLPAACGKRNARDKAAGSVAGALACTRRGAMICNAVVLPDLGGPHTTIRLVEKKVSTRRTTVDLSTSFSLSPMGTQNRLTLLWIMCSA